MLDQAAPLKLASLRTQVYETLRQALRRQDLGPGDSISLDLLSAQLGVSRTPVREALLRLELEGFVTIRPRSGIVVRRLTLGDIRNLYQMIGALEAAVLVTEQARLTGEHVAEMRRLNTTMREALVEDDFDRYYAANLDMHNRYIGLSANRELVHQVEIMKQRLYDFPRKTGFVKEWELASVVEHDEIIARLEAGDFAGAADFVRNVHWSFAVQERFILIYYREELETEDER